VRPPPHRRATVLVALATGLAVVLGGGAAPALADRAAAPHTVADRHVEAAGEAGPATPVGLWASTASSVISLTWQQPRTGSPARSFRVYEGERVVARTSTTSTVLQVAFGSSHSYTVTAVDADGRESAPTAPVTGKSWLSGLNPECLPPTVVPITVTEVSASAVSLTWQRHPLPGDLEVHVNGVNLGPTSLTSIRIGGLAPASSNSVALYRYNRCHSGPPMPVGWTTVTTEAGPAERPAAPTGLTVAGRTDSTVSLTWTAPAGTPAPAKYAVYDGGTLVATSKTPAVTVKRLFHATWHRFTVAALDAAGNESTHSPAASTATETCLAEPPRPVGLTALALSPSSVRLSWTLATAATSYTIFDRDAVVTTTRDPEAVVSGLASASAHSYRVSATLPQSCGETRQSTAVKVTTYPGPAARAAAPGGLTVTGNVPTTWPSGAQITLAWSPSAGAEPAVGYRVYDGAWIVGETSTATTIALQVGAATTHRYTVVAVDAANLESAASLPVTVQATYLPPP